MDHKAEDDAGVTSALHDLVGGLDSQIRALCRNLESLVGFGTGQQNTASTEASLDEESYRTGDEDVAAEYQGRSVDVGTLDEER